MKRLLSVVILFCSSLGFAAKFPQQKELRDMMGRFAPVRINVDTSKLSSGDQKALKKIVEAAKILDKIFLDQFWGGNSPLYDKLSKDKTDLAKLQFKYFKLNMGPWSALDEGVAFLPEVPAHHPSGANFYPEDATKEELEKWMGQLSKEDQEKAHGFFWNVRRNADKKLYLVPFSQEYAPDLKKVSDLLKQAAQDTDNDSLKKFLVLRAEALLTDDYFNSDLAWMDLDAPLDITIGPYETYNDEIFGYKASFESFITLRDDQETAKLGFFASQLQDVENNLPIDQQYRNPKLGASAPIRVVNQIIATGDANHGVRTAAFNLPNDDRVVHEKGSKRVMLKNIQEAKFNRILIPISKRVLSSKAQKSVNFEWFFTHILAHELSHGIGPHKITVQGRETDPHQELKETYGAIEEAKADITGLYMLQYLFDHGDQSHLKGGEEAERMLYTTFLASTFRTLRFGSQEAHGKGMAVQLNYLIDKGGFKVSPKGQFEVDPGKIKAAVQGLTHDLLTIEATGDYAGAKRLLEEKTNLRPEVKKALESLKSLPTDIYPL